MLVDTLLRTQGRSLLPRVVVSLGRRLGHAWPSGSKLPLRFPPFLAGLGSLLSLGLELRVLFEQVPAVALGGLTPAIGVARWLRAVLRVKERAESAVFPPVAGAQAL